MSTFWIFPDRKICLARSGIKGNFAHNPFTNSLEVRYISEFRIFQILEK
jgi:hypothetical protein